MNESDGSVNKLKWEKFGMGGLKHRPKNSDFLSN